MPALALSKDSISRSIEGIEVVGDPRVGGQKAVYPIQVRNKKYALKVIVADAVSASSGNLGSVSLPDVEETIARLRRETETQRNFSIPQLAKIGPIPLSTMMIDGHRVFYYSEEWIDGPNLEELIRRKSYLSPREAAILGIDVTKAIEALWSNLKIHRDIKPPNIIKRSSDHHYVLLDLGIALDLADVSLTRTGYFPGTFPYYSPEQTYPANKRQMDFRSDLFNLGLVLYEALTGKHPFLARNRDFDNTVDNIRHKAPPPLSLERTDVPKEMERLIDCLLAKKPHLRPRSCEELCNLLTTVGKIQQEGKT